MVDYVSDPALTQFLDLLLDVVCVVDSDGHFQYVSAACESVFGFTQEEMVGKTVQDLVHPDDREYTLNRARQVMAGTDSTQFENRYLRKDGEVVHIMWSARWSEEGQVRIGVARDITRRKQAELVQSALFRISQAAHRERDLGILLDQIHDIVAKLVPARGFYLGLWDYRDGRWNYPFSRDRENAGAAQAEGVEPLCEQVRIKGQTLLSGPGALTTGDTDISGSRSCYWLGAPLTSEQGVIGALVVRSDSPAAGFSEEHQQLLEFVADQVTVAISQQRLLARLEQRAQYDALTGLPNRALLDDRLQKAISVAERESGMLALLFVDMDDFKRVNDTLGHAAGDCLLQLTAQRLLASVRASDTVARLGGDEFIIVLEGLAATDHAQVLVDKIQGAFALPFELDHKPLLSPVSIGMALYPDDGTTPESLLRHADKRMYAAKETAAAQRTTPSDQEQPPGSDATQ
ncbi:diguanylate cyclase [Kineobactrum sediminis]|uniref:Diguanylate cyclase n=1 Tax=Kineobactrum sediminis TaxID=1905677 RepID=A0A2N5Y7C9_9GAMM|nr:GGDEF domain-containing protein [Kineobactrum sediminis]PLW84298.1 diguanylate cyclase [Kineobactrum sediminis]